MGTLGVLRVSVTREAKNADPRPCNDETVDRFGRVMSLAQVVIFDVDHLRLGQLDEVGEGIGNSSTLVWIGVRNVVHACEGADIPVLAKDTPHAGQRLGVRQFGGGCGFQGENKAAVGVVDEIGFPDELGNE